MTAALLTYVLSVSVLVLAASSSPASSTTLPRNSFQETESNSTWTALWPSTNGSDSLTQGLCRLTTKDPYVHNKVVRTLTEATASLIEYQLSFSNYSRNPLKTNVAGAYDAKKWSRVTTAHGQTLLSLAFNHGVLSMMTLTYGTETRHIELEDWPPGCMEAASDQRKIESVRHLLMRDFDADGPIRTVDDDRVCYEIIKVGWLVGV